jgi:peptide chain release factor 1
MIDKLDAIRARFDELGVALTNPAIVNDNKKFSTTSKEYEAWKKL